MCLRPQSHGIRGAVVMLLLFSACGVRTGLLVFFGSAAATETGRVGLRSGTPATFITSSRGGDTWLGQAERSEILKIHADDALRPHPHAHRHFPKLLFSSLLYPDQIRALKKNPISVLMTTTNAHKKYVRPPWGVKPETKEEHSKLRCQKVKSDSSVWTDSQVDLLIGCTATLQRFATSLCFMPTLASQF